MGLLSLLGIDPVGKIIDGLNRAYDTKINGQTEQQRIAANEQIEFYKGALADMQNARSAASNYPWWLALPMGFVALSYSAHAGLIALGTTLQPIIFGTWLGAWLLHIPALPAPYDVAESTVLAFFFGAGAAVGLGAMVVKAFKKV